MSSSCQTITDRVVLAADRVGPAGAVGRAAAPDHPAARGRPRHSPAPPADGSDGQARAGRPGCRRARCVGSGRTSSGWATGEMRRADSRIAGAMRPDDHRQVPVAGPDQQVGGAGPCPDGHLGGRARTAAAPGSPAVGGGWAAICRHRLALRHDRRTGFRLRRDKRLEHPARGARRVRPSPVAPRPTSSARRSGAAVEMDPAAAPRRPPTVRAATAGGPVRGLRTGAIRGLHRRQGRLRGAMSCNPECGVRRVTLGLARPGCRRPEEGAAWHSVVRHARSPRARRDRRPATSSGKSSGKAASRGQARHRFRPGRTLSDPRRCDACCWRPRSSARRSRPVR